MSNVAKKTIVDKVIERLKTLPAINPDLPETICFFRNPFREISEEELPCVKVALLRGKSERINNAIEYENEDTLMVAYQAQGNEDSGLEDKLYDAQEAIKDFLIKDENDSGNPDALHHLLSDLEFEDWDMDLVNAAVGTGAIVLKFNITYHTKHVLSFDDDLEGFEVTIKHTDAGEDTDPIAVDSIDLPTE